MHCPAHRLRRWRDEILVDDTNTPITSATKQVRMIATDMVRGLMRVRQSAPGLKPFLKAWIEIAAIQQPNGLTGWMGRLCLSRHRVQAGLFIGSPYD